MRTLKLLIPVCLAGSVGCFPVITHGARVETGTAFGLTASITGGDEHVEGDEGGIHLRDGIIGAYVGHGWAPSSDKNPGFYLGLAIPVLFPATQVDAYFQAPPAWTGPLQAGLGVTANYEGAHGYAMLGKQDDRGIGWSLHAGYGQRGAASEFLGRSPAAIAGGAVHFALGRLLHGQVYVQGANGREPESCFSDPPGSTTRRCTPGQRANALAGGISMGWLIR
jgi:hypothetical protein